MLGRYGYPARIADVIDDGIDGRAHSFDDGHRPDLVARITDNGDLVRRGDWLVVQHKTTAVGHNAHDELATHVDWLRAELADRLGDAQVHGLLIADGASLLLERALRERAFGYLSLSPSATGAGSVRTPGDRRRRPRRHRHRLPGDAAAGFAGHHRRLTFGVADQTAPLAQTAGHAGHPPTRVSGR